jgi:uncharacterized membrane protein YccC
MKAWLRQNRAKLQFGLRMTLAAIAAYAAGEALELAQTYWAVLSAVMVMQGSVGGSLKAGIDRLAGTAGGAVWGAAVAILVPHESASALGAALLLAVAPLAAVTAFWPAYRVAPITAIIVVMGGQLVQADPVSSAISRVFEIALGSVIAILVAFFILPARAHRLLVTSASAAASEMAGMASMLARAPGSGANGAALLQILLRIKDLIAQTETRAGEAKVERSNHLSDAPDPEPLARTLRRLRHDFAMAVRALGSPLQEAIRTRVEAPLEAVFAALSDWLEAVSKALAAGEYPPPLDLFAAAVEDYKAAVASPEKEALTYAGTGETERVFALLFLFEQMLQNLHDLAARTAELAGRSKPQTAPAPFRRD